MSERLFIITGASRGIGKAVTHALASSSEFSSGKMHFILSSTKQADLEAASAELEKLVSEKYGSTSNLKIYLQPVDFSDLKDIEKDLKTLCNLAQNDNQWDQVVLVLNHGSLGGLEFIEGVSSNVAQVRTPSLLFYS